MNSLDNNAYQIVCESVDFYNKKILTEIGTWASIAKGFSDAGRAIRQGTVNAGRAAKATVGRNVGRMYQFERDASNKARKYLWNKRQASQAEFTKAKQAVAKDPTSLRTVVGAKLSRFKRDMYGRLHSFAKKNQGAADSRFRTLNIGSEINFGKAGIDVPKLK